MARVYDAIITKRERREATRVLREYGAHRIFDKVLRRTDPELHQCIEAVRDYLSNGTARQVLGLIAGTTKVPECLCGDTVVTKWDRGGPASCDDFHCEKAAECIKAKKRATCLRRYGAENPFGSETIRDRIRRTNIRRYGVPVPAQNPNVAAKMARTNMRRYGTKTPAQNPEVRARMEATNMARRGVANCFKCPIAQAKTKQTMLRNWGDEIACRTPEVKALIVQGFLER